MNRQVLVHRLRQVRGEAAARQHHFRERHAVRGELGAKRLEEAADRLDRDIELLESLAGALDRAKAGTTVEELLEDVRGDAGTTAFEV